VASAGLTALFGFAVAGAGMVVHEQELSPLASEVLPYATVFVAAIAFSPVLRWAREMVERQMLARWADLEVRVNAFADQLAAELEPVRIAERVEAEVPALLGVARAELVLSRERVAGWRGGDGEEDVLPTEPLRTLHAELAADPPEPRLSAAVLGPGGALMGVLRVELRRHAAEPDPPQQAALAALVRGIGAALRIAEGYLRLRHAQRELSDAERVASLGAMAGGLAHEIKNPLLGLKLGLHLLRREGGNRERLERLAQDVGRIDDLVTGLLRFTHDEVHEEAGPVDVSELVRGCVRELRPLADDRSAVIREDYPDAGARVHATPMQLRLVVNNLVKNALDAVPDPGVVEVSVARRGGQVEVRVGDNGPGIPAPLRERLFDLAFSTKPGGSGIGLAVARRETERMGGTIQVDTASGDGTSMRVVLPHAPG
jgi:signal transduction histidine kinase